MKQTANSLKIELHQVGVRGPHEFESAFSTMVAARSDALVVLEDGMLIAHARRIAALATAKRLPSVGFKEYAVAGGLVAYAVDFPVIWRRAAVLVDKILKGQKPGTLPVERATHFETIINLKTVKALGLTIPPSVLARADELIQ
jgi:putative ABC transport system substrate-binding protein